MTGVSVFTELQIHSPRQHSFLSIVASPLIFLSPGFEVILLNSFTLYVTLSLSENRARHRPTASSNRCHKWFSRALLDAMLFSRSVDSCLRRSILRARFCPRA